MSATNYCLNDCKSIISAEKSFFLLKKKSTGGFRPGRFFCRHFPETSVPLSGNTISKLIRLITYVITSTSKNGKYEAGFTNGGYRAPLPNPFSRRFSHLPYSGIRRFFFNPGPSDFSARCVVGKNAMFNYEHS